MPSSSSPSQPPKAHSYTFKDKYGDKEYEVTAYSVDDAYKVLAAQMTNEGKTADVEYLKHVYDLKASSQKGAKAEVEQAHKTRAIEGLKKDLPPGTTIYTILKHVSSSGMMRTVDMVYVKNGEIVRASPSALEEAGLGYKYDNNAGGWRIGGAGMDMGFAIVYDVSTKLYGHEERGGYALKQRWL